MQPSLTLCRTQEARQRAIATAASLDNVRAIADAAAQAWAKEALDAERRENRKFRAVETDQVRELNPGLPDLDRLLSENPDRFPADEDDGGVSLGF